MLHRSAPSKPKWREIVVPDRLILSDEGQTVLRRKSWPGKSSYQRLGHRLVERHRLAGSPVGIGNILRQALASSCYGLIKQGLCRRRENKSELSAMRSGGSGQRKCVTGLPQHQH